MRGSTVYLKGQIMFILWFINVNGWKTTALTDIFCPDWVLNNKIIYSNKSDNEELTVCVESYSRKQDAV